MSDVCATIIAEQGWPELDEPAFAAFFGSPDLGIVFVRGTDRSPENPDVAVVLRELLRSRNGIAVAVPARAAEIAARRAIGPVALPCVVWVARGQVLAKVERMRDWVDYVAADTAARAAFAKGG